MLIFSLFRYLVVPEGNVEKSLFLLKLCSSHSVKTKLIIDMEAFLGVFYFCFLSFLFLISFLFILSPFYAGDDNPWSHTCLAGLYH